MHAFARLSIQSNHRTSFINENDRAGGGMCHQQEGLHTEAYYPATYLKCRQFWTLDVPLGRGRSQSTMSFWISTTLGIGLPRKNNPPTPGTLTYSIRIIKPGQHYCRDTKLTCLFVRHIEPGESYNSCTPSLMDLYGETTEVDPDFWRGGTVDFMFAYFTANHIYL